MSKRSSTLWMIMILFTVAALLLTAFAPAGGFAQTAAATPKPTVAPTPIPPFALTILHTNDIHASHAPDSAGDGGAALAAGVIKQVRAASRNTLLLNAGDMFTGSLYHVMHQGIDSATLLKAVQYDAMTLGNHEFDDGDGALALFIKAVRIPIVVANVDFSKSSALKDKTVPYTILTRGGQKIGLIGLANPDTPILARPGSDLVFDSDLAGITQKYVDELTGLGVNKIIVLSHNGFKADSELAAKVKGVDIIVGGHSHTLLANAYAGADGPYPAVLKGADEKTVLVVQAGEKLKYIGQLNVEFDENGDLTKWGGDVVYLSHFITPESRITWTVRQLYAPISKLMKQKIGETAVLLQGDRKVCRFEECNLGNLIADAMRKETGVQIAMENGGGIRASIQQGPVTMGDVLSVLPFGNLISTFKLTGEDLLATLENSVSRVDSEEGTGRFMQVSGMRFTYDPKAEVGKRIIKVEVMDDKGEYQPLDPAAVYTVATNDFNRLGGDDFKVLLEKAIDPYDFGRPLDQVLADYIKANSPVNIDVEGRITAVK